MLKALCVDLDDTLVAFNSVGDAAWRTVWTEYAARRTGAPADLLHRTVKEISERFWSDLERHRVGRLDIVAARRRFVGEAFAGLGLPAGDAVACADRYSALRLELMHLLPGAEAALATLRPACAFMALVTNGDSAGQRAKIERFGLARRFDGVYVEEELGFGKPDPRVYGKVLADSGCADPAEALMVGDNLDWDVRGARRLGLRAVWIRAASAQADPNAGPAPAAAEAADPALAPEAVLSAFADLPAYLGLEAGPAR
jgi:putative hydrolase of the HAD superfamily